MNIPEVKMNGVFRGDMGPKQAVDNSTAKPDLYSRVERVMEAWRLLHKPKYLMLGEAELQEFTDWVHDNPFNAGWSDGPYGTRLYYGIEVVPVAKKSFIGFCTENGVI